MMPRMEVLQPGSKSELDTLIRSQYNNGNPTYFRLSDHGHTLDVPGSSSAKANILKDSGRRRHRDDRRPDPRQRHGGLRRTCRSIWSISRPSSRSTKR